MSHTTRRDIWFSVLLLLGAGSLVNAAWMLVAPLHWYHDLPAAVPDFGAFNPHFVRDIGCAFVMVGAAQVWAAFAPRHRYPLVAMTALFLVAHAALHVYDTVRGAVHPIHWWLDLPTVHAPALLIAVLALILARRDRRERQGGLHASSAHPQSA